MQALLSTLVDTRHAAALMYALRAFFFVVLFSILSVLLLLYKTIFISNADLSSFWAIYGLLTAVFLISRIPYSYLYTDEHAEYYTADQYPSVSFVIAVKNEEDGIAETIRACLQSEYPAALECIVIDDGSTDGTGVEISSAKNKFGDQLTVVTFENNKGKRQAMAAGVTIAQHDVIVFVDSDSFLAPDGVRHITEHFIQDPTLGAVAGNTTVYNTDENTLTKMQSIQYAISFDVYKASESIFSAVTCCPGCFSAYRREAIVPLLDAWLHQTFLGTQATFGDDRGLTNFVLKEWNIIYCRSARATTIVPRSLRVYLRQQLRWKKSWFREGIFASLFMWRRHPIASFSFYVNFSFPFLAPILVIYAMYESFLYQDPYIAVMYGAGFMALGLLFSSFVSLFYETEHFAYILIFSLFFVTVMVWQMLFALATVTRTHWGTR